MLWMLFVLSFMVKTFTLRWICSYKWEMLYECRGNGICAGLLMYTGVIGLRVPWSECPPAC